MKATLGQTYIDQASKFVGVATARAEYLGDTPSIRLTAQKGTEVLVEVWIPEQRLEPHDDRPAGFAT